MSSRLHGRLLVRSGRIAGVFIPFAKSKLKPGIYDIYSVLMDEDDVALIYRGESCSERNVDHYNPDFLLMDKTAFLTKEEFARLKPVKPKRKKK